MTNWKGISSTPPKTGKVVVARTVNFLGLGRTYEVFDFAIDAIGQDEYECFLNGSDFIEWMELPE